MSYYSAKIAELQATKPPQAESFFNQSFIDRINEAQAQIDGRYQEMKAAGIQKKESQDAYNTFKGEMRDYSELSKEAENQYGVATAKNNYEESKRAIETVEQTLDALPSTINANSERVMTQSRFELAYNAEASKWESRMRGQQTSVDVNKKVWDNARRNADAMAAAGMAQQQAKLESLSSMWNIDLNEFGKATKRWQEASEFKLQREEEYLNWKYQQAQEAYNRWAKEIAYYQKAKALEDAKAEYAKAAGYYLDAQKSAEEAARYRNMLQGFRQNSMNNRYSGGGGGGGGGGGW